MSPSTFVTLYSAGQKNVVKGCASRGFNRYLWPRFFNLTGENGSIDIVCHIRIWLRLIIWKWVRFSTDKGGSGRVWNHESFGRHCQQDTRTEGRLPQAVVPFSNGRGNQGCDICCPIVFSLFMSNKMQGLGFLNSMFQRLLIFYFTFIVLEKFISMLLHL